MSITISRVHSILHDVSGVPSVLCWLMRTLLSCIPLQKDIFHTLEIFSATRTAVPATLRHAQTPTWPTSALRVTHWLFHPFAPTPPFSGQISRPPVLPSQRHDNRGRRMHHLVPKGGLKVTPAAHADRSTPTRSWTSP